MEVGGSTATLLAHRDALTHRNHTQLIVLSFTLIIASMLATFFVVLKSGGVRFNED